MPPTDFPHYDPTTDELLPHPYYDVREVAELLHVSPSTVGKNVREGRWERLHTARGYFMSAAMIGDALEQMKTDNRPEPEPEPPALGVVLDEADSEPIR